MGCFQASRRAPNGLVDPLGGVRVVWFRSQPGGPGRHGRSPDFEGRIVARPRCRRRTWPKYRPLKGLDHGGPQEVVGHRGVEADPVGLRYGLQLDPVADALADLGLVRLGRELGLGESIRGLQRASARSALGAGAAGAGPCPS